MRDKTWLIKLTEWSTFIIPFVTLIGGILYVYEHGHEKVSYKGEMDEIIETGLGHQIIIAGMMLLILFQLTRLSILIYDFLRQKDWPYVYMGTFILVALLLTLSLAWV